MTIQRTAAASTSTAGNAVHAITTNDVKNAAMNPDKYNSIYCPSILTVIIQHICEPVMNNAHTKKPLTQSARG